jgi:hypothetical protein
MKLSLYFLFYVAMILELLIFIVDRDMAEDTLIKNFGQFAKSQAKLHISGPSELKLYKGETSSTPFLVTGFWDKEEKKLLQAIVDNREYSAGKVMIDKPRVTLIPDTTYGGFRLTLEGVQEDSVTISISAVLHRTLSAFPEEVRPMILAGVAEDERIGKDTIVVRCDTLKLQVVVIEKRDKLRTGGKRLRETGT